MTEEAALLAAIIAAPADDTVRLAYADWLDEQGRAARAEFIRVQIELLRGGPFPAAMRQRHVWLLKRQIELISAGGTDPTNGWSDFIAAFGAAPPPGVTECCMRHWARGFVDSVDCPVAAWIDHGDAFRAAHPITEVRLTTVSPGLRAPNFASRPGPGLSCAVRIAGRRVSAKKIPTNADVVPTLLSLRWPGVTFRMPVR